MIKANVILDYSKWKNKIKDPEIYVEKKINQQTCYHFNQMITYTSEI